MKIWISRFGLLLFPILVSGCVQNAENQQKSQSILMVINKSENSATVLDPESGKKLAELITGVSPHEVAFTPVSQQAVITNYGTRENPGSSLTVVDLKSFSVSKTINLERYRRPHGIQFFSDGKRIAVTVEGNQALLVVNIETGEIEKVIHTEQRTSHMVVLSRDERYAFVANIESGSISVLNLEESRLVKNIETGEGAEGLDISPNGKELWVANRAEDSIAIVDTDRLEVVEKLACSSFPIRVRFTPDGKNVMVSNARSGDVAVFSFEDRREVQRVTMEYTATETEDRLLDFKLSPVPIGIVFDPTYQKAFVANSNADIVSVIDLKKWQVSGRLKAGKEPDGMVFTLLQTPR